MLKDLVKRIQNKKPANPLLMKLSGFTAALLLSMSFGMTSSLADDTEIFTAGTPPPPESTNVVFLIDTSGSMWQTMSNDPSNTRKIHAVQNVFEKLIFDVANTGNHNSVNPAMKGRKIALMRFDDGDSNGGYFLTPMLTLNNGSKDEFWSEIQGLVQYQRDANGNIVNNEDGSPIVLSPSGTTPLAESAYEAALFFRGETPVYGNRLPPEPGSNNRTSPGINDPGVMDGTGKYKSPFQDANNISQCGINNHLVILTDGLPRSDDNADDAINALANTTDDCQYVMNTSDCLPQVAEHLYKTDLFDDIDGAQKVMTHTIAFDLSNDNTALQLLRDTADIGGGMAARADNATELADAIESILRDIQESSVSFVNPAVSVSNTNRFVHDNTVYFGLFKPELSPMWKGNLKGYQYSADGELYDFSATPQLAIVNGTFSPSAKSKWSSAIDGGNVEQGGAAEQILSQGSRNIFTQNSTTPSSSTLVDFSVANETNIPAADFGDNVSNNLKIELIQWATSRESNPIGDPLHSQPVIIDYGSGTGPVIFFGTNQGFLHAISAETGQELMAFIPKSLLSNIRTIRDNNSQDDHPYGIDGYISYYRYDANGDGEIHSVDNDKALVIFGMRRGGNEFFALNVTDPSNPTLQWYIHGGSGDFAELGLSWSKPVLAKMNFGDSANPTSKDVVLIGGGYDTQYDELDNEITDPAGAAIYAVDLDSGACLWSASDSESSTCTNTTTPARKHTTVSGLSNSIPSHISAIDLTSDGVIDRLYAIDILGKVFRIDLNTLDNQSDYAPSGQLFADLSGGTRRFYYGVDVAYTNSGFTPKLHLSVGSGHRAHPLANNSSDAMFSIWDVNVFNALPVGFSAITVDSLSNITALDAELSSSTGWYFNLGTGEKVLSMASSLAGYVFFSTYTPPDGVNNNTCEVAYGSGNVYAVKLADASPLENDRAIPINSTGIPSEVAFMTLYQPDGGDETNPDNPLTSQDTEVFAMVNGTKVNLSADAQDKINTSTEATKAYWFIGEP